MINMSFIQANRLFNSGDYEQALQIYLKLADKYDITLVNANIQSCIDRIECNKKEARKFKRYLDNNTKILLDNENATLQAQERNAILEKISVINRQISKDAAVKPVKIPKEWPKDLILPALPDSTNDYVWYQSYKKDGNRKSYDKSRQGLSVIIPTFNRSKILSITLASLVKQRTHFSYEIIVADDGSSEDISRVIRNFEHKLDIKYVRQKDYGYQLCAVRNLGIRTAKYDFIAILDCDMAANPYWVDNYIKALIDDNDIAYIGPRKYIDSHHLDIKQVLEHENIFETLLPVKSDSISTSSSDGISKDWRLNHFEQTDNLRLCNTPFRFFSGGNVAFDKKWLSKSGWFDEEFTHWGGEDNEFGYRLYREGCFFCSLDGAMAYHQEPPGKENETERSAGQAITRKIIERKIPYFYRKLASIETAVIKTIPLVSIYIPAYNCQDSIIRCVESALNQTVTDLEVCICNDGSTDKTLEVLEKHYTDHPRVRFITQENSGIAKASNTAVNMCRGFYIGQLDSDDYLEPDAVALCLREFFSDRNLVCVYTTNRNVNKDGSLIADGYNWPEFSREKLMTAMILHHFRMFTIRAWKITTGFDETIENAVDYDMYLKLSEVGKFKHINKICYNRTLHTENTSIKKLDIQKKNHFLVVNNALKRQGMNNYSYDETDDDKESRKFRFSNKNPLKIL